MFVKNRFVFAALLSLLMADAALVSAADYAPTPRHAPRVPVARQQLADKQPSVPPSRILEGSAIAIDSEKLKLQNYELRLFGIVPPQLSASFGPQARNAMDKLTQGTTVQCQIRDRASDGRLLATCQNATGTDLALDLLRHGLAVTARGSLHQSELAGPYAAAEQAAQNQKIGLWSGVLPIPAPAVTKTEPKVEAAAPLPPTPPAEKEMAIKVEPIPAASLATTPTAADLKKASLAATADSVVNANPDALSDEDLLSSWQARPLSFLERYQLLFTGLLMLVCALSVVAVILFQRRHDRHEEKRAIAAAIRGELMAARAVCIAKLQSFTEEGAAVSTMTWPRIRVLVFQAYVGRIGGLGAELARQVSSIYGLASDYASFYQSPSSAEAVNGQIADRKQALQKLIGHIETVLPKLASVENHTFFSPTPRKDYQPMVSPPSYDPIPALKSETDHPLSLTSAPAAQTPPATACEKTEAPKETSVEKKNEEKKEEAVKEPAGPKSEVKNETTEIKSEEPFVAPVQQADAKTTVPPKNTVQEQTKKTALSKKERPAETTPSDPLLGKASAVWSRIKDIKEQLHSKLVPPPVEIADQDEYMAMLKAEAELFATYDLSDVETPPTDTKRQKAGT